MHGVRMFEILFQNMARLWGHFEVALIERHFNSINYSV